MSQQSDNREGSAPDGTNIDGRDEVEGRAAVRATARSTPPDRGGGHSPNVNADAGAIDATAFDGDRGRANGSGDDEQQSSRASSSRSSSGGERVRMRTRTETDEDEIETDEETETTGAGERQTDTCPECEGRIIEDSARGEMSCTECGLVVEEDMIDPGPEWRAYNQSETESRRRVGSPESNLQHDKGLSTHIGWQDRDAYGNSLNSQQRRLTQKLRKWNERTRTKSSSERNLKKALGEIERMSSQLGLPTDVREVASSTYRSMLDENMLQGRSIEGMSTAAIHIACRICNIPRTLNRIAEASRVEEREIASAYRYASAELGLELVPRSPERYVNMVSSGVGAPSAVRGLAREMVGNYVQAAAHSGKSPSGIAAAAVYAAEDLIGEEGLTQKDAADAGDVCEVTVRSRQKELLEHIDAETVDSYRRHYDPEEDVIEADEGRDIEMSADTRGDRETDVEDGVSADEEAALDVVDEERETMIVSFADDMATSEVMLDAVGRMMERGLSDHLDGEWVPPRCKHPLVLPVNEADECDRGTWHEIGAGLAINTKLNTRDKKTRLNQLGEVIDVPVEIID